MVADAAATVIALTAGDGDIRQIGCTTFVEQSAAVAAIAASQRSVTEVERGTFAHDNDLTTVVSTPLSVVIGGTFV